MKIYLYLKTHNKTGLKYLGQTTQDPHKYLGSGVRWINHLKKHGADSYGELEAIPGAMRDDIEKRIAAKGVFSYVAGQVIPPRVTRAAAQAAAEAGLDLSGEITRDMLYVRLHDAADGSYFELILRASGRELTSAEADRVVGVPQDYRKAVVGGDTIWYSIRGVTRTAEIITAQGWTVDPAQEIPAEEVQPPTKIICL